MAEGWSCAPQREITPRGKIFTVHARVCKTCGGVLHSGYIIDECLKEEIADRGREGSERHLLSCTLFPVTQVGQ